MEQKKIGVFIAQQRKEKQMTQKQLGEVLGISDKTVSKWETGHGLPDISMIMPLCEILDINVNELLSGEHLTQDTYPEKAEENIMNLMKDSEEQKKRNVKDIIISIAWIAGFVVFFLSLQLTSTISIVDNITHFIDMVAFWQIIFILVFSLYFAGHLKDFCNAFVFLLHKAASPQKLEDAIDAISLAEKTLIVSGVFCSIYSIIYASFLELDTASLAINTFIIEMAISLYPIFYGITGVMILMIVKGRLVKKLKN